MVVLGLILLTVCVLLVVGVAVSSGGPVDASVFDVGLSGVTVDGLFLAGVVLGALTLLALAMVLGGLARKRGKKRAARREVADARSEAETLADENARLQAELDRSDLSERR
jgi:Mg2+/citrate symporter